MALLTGSFGQSWLTSSQGAAPLSLQLPNAITYRYVSDMGVYASCGISSNYSILVVPIGTSSATPVKSGNRLAVNFTTFTTINPGLVDTIFYNFNEFLQISLEGILFHYGLGETLQNRYGAFVQASSGSPQLSLAPQTESFNSPPLPGDVWFGTTGSHGFKFGDMGATGIRYTAYAARSIDNDTISSSADRYRRGVGPRGAMLAINSPIANNWYISAISSSNTGFRNVSWDGGVHMIDSASVSIFGQHKQFIVPSGSMRMRDDLILIGGQIEIAGINLNTARAIGRGIIRIDTGSMSIFGSLIAGGTNAQLRGNDTARLFIEGAPFGIVHLLSESIALPPLPFDGQWYLYSGSGVSGSSVGFVGYSGSYYPFLSGSGYYSLLDGGRF